MTAANDEDRRTTLRQCIWLALRDRAYALWAASEYERRSAGALAGLRDELESEIRGHDVQRQAMRGAPA